MVDESQTTGYAVSSALHASLLAAIVIGFTQAPPLEDTRESIPVETISQTDFNQIMKGEKDAPPAKPAPAVKTETAEAEAAPPAPAPPTPVAPAPAPPPRPADPPVPPPPAPAVKTADIAPAPPVRPKVVETPTPTPKPTQVAKVEPPVKPIETPSPRPTPKVDPLAKLMDAPAPTPTKTSKPFDPNAISRSLNAIKPAATPEPVATEASIAPQGLPQHNAPKMSLSMKVGLDNWLQDAYRGCWVPPPTPPGDKYVAMISVEFAADGSLAGQPKLVNPPSDPAWRAYAESARRAVLKCNPLKIPSQYSPFFDEWRAKTVHFDPDNELG